MPNFIILEVPAYKGKDTCKPGKNIYLSILLKYNGKEVIYYVKDYNFHQLQLMHKLFMLLKVKAWENIKSDWVILSFNMV